jgi:hypothetical protein
MPAISRQADLGGVLREHRQRIKQLEMSDGSNGWVYVGTPGVDGVDALLTGESPPFENGWTNALGGQAPVPYKYFLNWVHIRGAFTGGSDNSVGFTLPIPGWIAPSGAAFGGTYAPAFPVANIGALADGSGVFSFVIGTDGTVTYGTAGAL